MKMNEEENNKDYIQQSLTKLFLCRGKEPHQIRRSEGKKKEKPKLPDLIRFRHGVTVR